MVRYKIHYKTPRSWEDTLRLVLVPIIAALLAVAGFTACDNHNEEPAWARTRNAPTEAPIFPKPAMHAELKVTTSPAPGTPSTSPGSPSSMSDPSPPKTKPATAPTPPKARVDSPVTSSIGPSASASSAKSSESKPSDLQEQQNFSTRTDPIPESIQGCQRSAATCFATGGLDTLMDNLDGLAIDPVTGRFCFSFQEGCERR